MNKSYDVYMCREPKQVFSVPINNYSPLDYWGGYPRPKQDYFDAMAKKLTVKRNKESMTQKMHNWLRGK